MIRSAIGGKSNVGKQHGVVVLANESFQKHLLRDVNVNDADVGGKICEEVEITFLVALHNAHPKSLTLHNKYVRLLQHFHSCMLESHAS